MEIKGLMDMLMQGGRDEERETILRETSTAAFNKMKVIAGGSELAEEFLVEMWSKLFKALSKSKVNPAMTVVPHMLRLMADTVESRNTQFKALDERRASQIVKPEIDKDMH